jgi:predicted aconitase
MILNEELLAVQRGEQGETMQKVLNTLIMYGEAFGAQRMVKITGPMGHCVIGTGSLTWTPVFDLMDKLYQGGAIPRQAFTTDPRGVDENVPMNLPMSLMFKVVFGNQKRLEQGWKRMGIKNDKAYTCTCYMPEVGNIPKQGDILGWAESSAVSYANSVIGARCNRNSGILEQMTNILGYVPEFGLLTDEGRKADWIIEVRTSELPEPQLLGSAIGFKCVEDVPYIKGLDRWLGTTLNQKVKDYLKDMGAASASNGSVGLYHVEHLTPEAVQQGASLIKKEARTFVIDDAEIERVRASYPILWDQLDADAEMAFAGCPHFSCDQLLEWTERISDALRENGGKKVLIPTILCAAPEVGDHFRQEYPMHARRLKEMGVSVSAVCPLSFTSNPLTNKIHIITCSNKLRYYSRARFFTEKEFLQIVTGGVRS